VSTEEVHRFKVVINQFILIKKFVLRYVPLTTEFWVFEV